MFSLETTKKELILTYSDDTLKSNKAEDMIYNIEWKARSEYICIKDMSGLLKPYVAEDLVKKLKAAVSVPIELHTHYTSGFGSMTYLKAVEAGVDIIDT